MSSRDVFDTLLPLFTGGSSDVRPTEAYVQHTQVSNDITDQPISDADLQDEIYEDRAENEQARGMPKWLVQTLRDSKIDAPMSNRTRLGFQHTSYASDCYALEVSGKCDEEEPLSFDEAQNS